MTMIMSIVFNKECSMINVQGNEQRIYEYVVRHFLACCSQVMNDIYKCEGHCGTYIIIVEFYCTTHDIVHVCTVILYSAGCQRSGDNCGD